MPLYLPPMAVQPDPMDVTRANATAAGTLYDQAEAASVVNLANDNKAKINAILARMRDMGALE